MTGTAIDKVLGPLDLIPEGEGRNFEVAGERIAVFRNRAGQIFATQAMCPHKNGPLADGLVGGSTVICPLHAWTFNLATGEPIVGTCRLQTYAARLNEQRQVVVTMPVSK